MLKKYGENKNLGLDSQDHFETKLKSFRNSQFFHIVYVICRRLLTMGFFMNKWMASIILMFPLTSFAQYGYSAYGYANAGLQGSGYWGGQQNCGYQVSQNTGGKSQGQQKEKTDSRLAELKKELAAKELEKKRSEKEMELAAKKLERVFDSEILDFLLEVHIEKGNTCADYKTFPGNRCGQQQASQTGSTAVGEATMNEDGSQVIAPATPVVMITTDCEGKEDVPEKLQAKWTKQGGGYCNANSRSSGGSVSAAICNDASLRNSDRKSSAQSSDCSKQLANYRKYRIKRDETQAKIERIEDEIEDRQYAIADEKERASLDGQSRMAKTEADCEECGMMDRDGSGGEKKSNRDWISTLGNIGVGLGLAYVGKQYDDRNAEYSAQLGYPPQTGYPTAVSLGLPFILNGVYGSVNGSNGQGSMGCGNSMSGINGMGNMNGMGQMGGAFGYPQSMYGQNPYGGGMYTMGYNPYMNGYGNQNLYGSNGYGMMANGMMNGYGTMMNGYGTMTGGMANYGTMSNYGNMSNYGLGTMSNNYQSQMLALQYQQQMSQYQMQYYQQQYQAQMQQYQQQQQVTQQSQQLQQEIYNLQMRLQNLYTGSYYNNGTSTSGLTATGGYYGTTYGTTTYGTTTAPTWIPGSTSTIYTTTPTYYNTTTTNVNGR